MLVGESEMRLLMPIPLPLRERDEKVPGGLPGADKKNKVRQFKIVVRTFEIYITLVSSLEDVVGLQ